MPHQGRVWDCGGRCVVMPGRLRHLRGVVVVVSQACSMGVFLMMTMWFRFSLYGEHAADGCVARIQQW